MIEKTIESYFTAIRELNAEKFAANFSADGAVTDPVGSATLIGPAAIKSHFLEICSAFSKIDLRAERTFICGNQAAVFFKGSGTGKGGKSASLEGIDVMEFDQSGKIMRMNGFWNPAAALKAIS